MTLTATVTPGATGKVTFYDGATVLGAGTLNFGEAKLNTVLLPTGTRYLHAHYSGDSAYAPSASPAIEQTVAAKLSSAFQPAKYNRTSATSILVGDFNNDGEQDLFAYNGSSTAYVLLGNGDGTFQPDLYQNVGAPPVGAAQGDFNGDGNADLAVLLAGAINVYPGNGDGTFGVPWSVGLAFSPSGIQVADFNGDGNADLLIDGYQSEILMGNGDGTFQTGNPKIVQLEPIAVGDFNGDGIADLLGTRSNLSGIWLGAGDGSFNAPGTSAFGLPSTNGFVVVADFNGDGNLDVASAMQYNSLSVAVALGNGDGTLQVFRSFRANPWGQPVTSLAAGDWNGDGKLDLITLNGTGDPWSYVNLALGNGDGTFQSPTLSLTYPVGGAGGLSVGEFNGDGALDVATTDQHFAGGVSVLLGAAVPDLSVSITSSVGLTPGQTGARYELAVTNTGTLSTVGAVTVVDSLPPGFTATAIFGSGWSCVLATLTCTRSDVLANGAGYPAITITVNISQGAGGNVTDSATVSGGGDQNSLNNTGTNTVFLRSAAPVSLTSAPNPATLGQLVTLTATLDPAATGFVSFFDGVDFLGRAPVSSGQAILATDLLASGVRNLTAEYNGDSNYIPAVSAVHPQTVSAVAGNGLLPRASYAVDVNPSVVRTGDLNGDGIPDLVTANTGIVVGSFSVLLGKGDGTFSAAVNYPLAGTPSTVVIGDFNEDGKADLVFSGSAAEIFFGNGDGSFPAVPSVVLNYLNFAPAFAADVNRDGILDLMGTGGPGGLNLEVAFGNGDGTFQPPAGTPIPNFFTFLYQDFNSDGVPDVVGAVATGGGPLTVYLGNADGTFRAPVNYTLPVVYPADIVAGDFDADGNLDVVVNGAALLRGKGDGTFEPAVNSIGAAGSQLAGDFNGDGKLDLAVRGYVTNTLIVSFGKGNGMFQAGIPISTDGYPGNAVVSDFNHDGRPDFAVLNGNTSSINVFLGAQAGSVYPASSHSGPFTVGQTGATYSLTVSDLDYAGAPGTIALTDTLPDGFTATKLSGPGWNCVLATLTCSRSDGLGGGSSYPAITLVVNISNASPPGTVNNRVSVTSGLGGASSTDATVLLEATNTSISASPGSSLLGQPVMLTATVTSGATGVVEFLEGANVLGAAQLSGGQAQLTTPLIRAGTRQLQARYVGDSSHAASLSPQTSFTVSTAAAGSFRAAPSIAGGNIISGIAVGDFNRDGKVDLVTSNAGANTVSVWLGNGNGSFLARKDYPAGAQPAAVAVGDLNADGKTDLAVVNQADGTVSVSLGNGDGTFQPARTFFSGGTKWTLVTIADLNGDGKQDVIVGEGNSSSGGTLSLLFGNGDGTLQAPPLAQNFSQSVLLLDGFPRDSSAADLNGDGRTDRIVISGGNLNVSLAKPDGTFTALTPATLTYGNNGIVVTDVNGDGKLDVVASGNSSGLLDIAFGNGDGTFQKVVSTAIGFTSRQMVSADFNGDSRPDLAFAEYSGNNVRILLGEALPQVVISSATAGQIEPFAPNSIVSAYGNELAIGTAVAGSPLGTTLGGTTVTVTDSSGKAQSAILFYASSGQINFLIPGTAAPGAATVTITNSSGLIQQAIIQIGSVSPGLFELNAAGLVAAWVLPVTDGVQQDLQPVFQVDSSSAVVPLPLDVSSGITQLYLEMYGTGIRNAQRVTATIRGIGVPVLYSGAAPGYAGEDQVNIGPLPPSLAGAGNVTIVLTADGQAANPVNVSIR